MFALSSRRRRCCAPPPKQDAGGALRSCALPAAGSPPQLLANPSAALPGIAASAACEALTSPRQFPTHCQLRLRFAAAPAKPDLRKFGPPHLETPQARSPPQTPAARPNATRQAAPAPRSGPPIAASRDLKSVPSNRPPTTCAATRRCRSPPSIAAINRRNQWDRFNCVPRRAKIQLDDFILRSGRSRVNECEGRESGAVRKREYQCRNGSQRLWGRFGCRATRR